MNLVFLVNMILLVFSEIDDFFFGSKAAKSLLWQMDKDSPLMSYLRDRGSILYDMALRNVIPAMELLKEAVAQLEALRDDQRLVSDSYESAMATLMTHQPELAMELAGGYREVAAMAEKGYRVEATRRRRIAFEEAHRRKKKIIHFISAGLGILNFISLVEIMGLDLHRFTPKSVVLLPLALVFSVAAVISIHVGLSDFITATRSYDIRADKPVHDNLFPYGWKDKAIWMSMILIAVDSLFSSVGLLQALPPSYQDEFFWRIAILAVSAFAAFINVLLAWGIALDRINYDFVLQHEAKMQRKEIIDLEPHVKTAKASKARLRRLEEQIKKKARDVVELKKEAHMSFRVWFRGVCRLQRKDDFFALVDRLRSQNARPPNELNGHAKSYLPPVKKDENSADKDKDKDNAA